MDPHSIENWDTLVETAILDIQESLSTKKDVSTDFLHSFLPFLNSSLIREICLERNWNHLCGNIICGNYRLSYAKVGEELSRSWFCSIECHKTAERYSEKAGEEDPKHRNLVKHLHTLYPKIPLTRLKSIYGKEDVSPKSDPPIVAPPTTVKTQVSGRESNNVNPWNANPTPAPKSLWLPSSSSTPPMRQAPSESPASSDSENEEFSLFRCFPLLSLLFDSWRTECSIKYFESGCRDDIPSVEDSPHRSDMEYILEKIHRAFAVMTVPDLPLALIDEIPCVVATFDLSRKYDFRDLMEQTNIGSENAAHISWLSMALAVYYTLAQFRFPDAQDEIVRLAERHTDLDKDSLASLCKILLRS